MSDMCDQKMPDYLKLFVSDGSDKDGNSRGPESIINLTKSRKI